MRKNATRTTNSELSLRARLARGNSTNVQVPRDEHTRILREDGRTTERLFTKYSGQGPLRGALSRLGLEKWLDGEGKPPVQLSGVGGLAYC